MNWQTELHNSLPWLLKSLCWLILGLFLTALLLRKTDFGQKFECIVTPCLTLKNRWKAMGLILLLLFFILLEVRISVLNTFFYNGLYTSMQNKAAEAFWFFALIFMHNPRRVSLLLAVYCLSVFWFCLLTLYFVL